jgi:hypothetical protein
MLLSFSFPTYRDLPPVRRPREHHRRRTHVVALSSGYAEGVGFEPTGSLHSQGFSSAVLPVAGVGLHGLDQHFCELGVATSAHVGPRRLKIMDQIMDQPRGTYRRPHVRQPSPARRRTARVGGDRCGAGVAAVA